MGIDKKKWEHSDTLYICKSNKSIKITRNHSYECRRWWQKIKLKEEQGKRRAIIFLYNIIFKPIVKAYTERIFEENSL